CCPAAWRDLCRRFHSLCFKRPGMGFAGDHHFVCRLPADVFTFNTDKGQSMSGILTFALIFSALRLSTPLIFAALGGLFSERSGVINIALEGLMLMGAFTAAVATYELNNPYLGLLCGVASGGALAFVYAV